MKLTPEQNKLAAELFKVDHGFPESLGECIDLLYKMRQTRHQLQAQVDDLKKDEANLRAHIQEHFDDAQVQGARGKLASCNIIHNVVAQVTDFEKAVIWIAKKKEYDLLYKRISDNAYRARVEAGISVPGVLPYEDVKLSLTKIGGKK